MTPVDIGWGGNGRLMCSVQWSTREDGAHVHYCTLEIGHMEPHKCSCGAERPREFRRKSDTPADPRD